TGCFLFLSSLSGDFDNLYLGSSLFYFPFLSFFSLPLLFSFFLPPHPSTSFFLFPSFPSDPPRH
ncbi:hypothetical protein COCVIDRAFT_97442, partial [Bipolaris victoriae FI3]